MSYLIFILSLALGVRASECSDLFKRTNEEILETWDRGRKFNVGAAEFALTGSDDFPEIWILLRGESSELSVKRTKYLAAISKIRDGANVFIEKVIERDLPDSWVELDTPTGIINIIHVPIRNSVTRDPEHLMILNLLSAIQKTLSDE